MNLPDTDSCTISIIGLGYVGLPLAIELAKNFDCKLIIQKDKGYGSAIIEGFKHAKNVFGCIYNADYSFDPKYFGELLRLSKSNDFIFGSRYMGSGGSEVGGFDNYKYALYGVTG